MREPDPSLRLLWRHDLAGFDAETRRGPRQRLSVDQVVDGGIELADRDGLTMLSMRRLAQHLGMGTMTLYTYVPGRIELITLMVDQVAGRRELPEMPGDLRARMSLIARVQYDDCRAHPWLLDVTGVRPWLGPHAIARYEWQLGVLEGIGLDDVELDQAVTLLVGFASQTARDQHLVAQAERESGSSDVEWWETNADAVGELLARRPSPLAERVGSAAGRTYQAATDPDRQLEFGLARILDGLLAYLPRRGPGV